MTEETDAEGNKKVNQESRLSDQSDQNLALCFELLYFFDDTNLTHLVRHKIKRWKSVRLKDRKFIVLRLSTCWYYYFISR